MSLSHELSASARVLSAPLKPHCFTDKGSVTQEFKKAMRRLTSTVTLIATEHEGAPWDGCNRRNVGVYRPFLHPCLH